MKLTALNLLLALFIVSAGVAAAQDRLPVREYTNPDELVVLDESMDFEEALSLFEEFSEEFTGRIIIDRSGFSGEIGVEVPQMHWFDALERVAGYNNLAVLEHERYIEIEEMPDEEADRKQEAARKLDDETINFNTREIEIKATFFEVNRSAIRELGVDWSAVSNGRVQVDHQAADRIGDPAIGIQISGDDVGGTGVDISALFNALESMNEGEVISSPTIKVMEGESGRIQVGQDFSLRQRDFAGNIVERFFSTGTILEVVPNILYHEGTPYIYMTVRAERSTVAPGETSTIVNKQEAETEVLMLSGETTVIAGLYETEENVTRRGVPLLKDLPGWFFGLRYLFGYNSTEHIVQELVVVLETSLVPTLEQRLEGVFESAPNLIRDMRNEFQEFQLEDLER